MILTGMSVAVARKNPRRKRHFRFQVRQMSSSLFTFSGGLQLCRQCAPVVAVAGVIFAILVSARSAPKDPVAPTVAARVDRVDTARSALARSDGQTNPTDAKSTAPHVASHDPMAGERVPSLSHRYGSFNASLVKPMQANASGRFRSPRVRMTANGETQPKPRGVSIDVLSSRTSRPIEVGRNGTSTDGEVER